MSTKDKPKKTKPATEHKPESSMPASKPRGPQRKPIEIAHELLMSAMQRLEVLGFRTDSAENAMFDRILAWEPPVIEAYKPAVGDKVKVSFPEGLPELGRVANLITRGKGQQAIVVYDATGSADVVSFDRLTKVEG